MFGSSLSALDAASSVAELEFWVAASELESGSSAVALDFADSVDELDVGAPVVALDLISSIEELDAGCSDADEGSLSQLTQKKLVTARAIFFQCL